MNKPFFIQLNSKFNKNDILTGAWHLVNEPPSYKLIIICKGRWNWLRGLFGLPYLYKCKQIEP